MDENLFQRTTSGTLVNTIEGTKAFKPNSLPPEINLANFFEAYGETFSALGGLNAIGREIVNPYMVIRPLQRNEALRSSAMEGTYSTADDLAIVEAYDDASKTDSDREVANYVRAIDYALSKMDNIPISHRLIKGMHEILLGNSSKNRGGNKRAGEYKIHQNWIGAKQIERARFIPPPPDLALTAMDDLERFINNRPNEIPPLIAAALIHYQFESIHPFGDGNGRVGRMLVTLYLLSTGVIDSPLLYVSQFIEDNKDEYIDSMFAVSSEGDWDRWINFFLLTIKESCASTIETIAKLKSLETAYRLRLQENTKSVSALTICDYLFEHPVISITEAASQAKIAYPSAKLAIEQLCKNEILSPIKGFEKPKLFWAREIIRISDGV